MNWKQLFTTATVFGLLSSISEAASRPNVLFVAVDDLRTNLGCYGDDLAITPNLDRLASRGTVFTRAYCQQAVCNPSRQSLLSGRRPDSIRVWDLRANFRDTAPDVVSLPEHFKLNGYFTQGIGKIFHEIGYQAGIDPQSWSVPELFEYVPKIEDYRLPENRSGGPDRKAAAVEFADAPDDAYPDGKVAAAAVAALERLAREGRDRPFFLAVGIRKPHLPFTAPRKYWDLYDSASLELQSHQQAPRAAPRIALHDSVELRGYSDIPAEGELPPDLVTRLRRAYYAATSFADAQVGRVLDALERTGLADDTIVVLWSDHGYHLGEHGLWVKTTNYESDTRVPLIISVPGQARPQRVAGTLVELLDLYPTLTELCGLPIRDLLEGRSLVPWLQQPEAPGPQVAFSQFPRPWPNRQAPQIMGYSVRTAEHRYVEWRQFGTTEVVARELYSYLEDELLESENLAGQAQWREVESRLAALLPPVEIR